RIASAANGGGTKITDASAPVSLTASSTVSNTGSPMCSLPPLPGVTPPTSRVPYSSACSEWKVPCWPVKPWVMTLVFLSTKTLMCNSLDSFPAIPPVRHSRASGNPLRSSMDARLRGHDVDSLFVSRNGSWSRGLRRRDRLAGRIVEVVCRGDREARPGEQFAALLDVGALQAHDHGDRQADLLDRRDDALGDEVAAHDAAEDVDQDAAHLVRGQDQLECLGHALGGRATTDIEEIRGLATGELDHVHRRHREAGAVDHAADVAVHGHVIEIVRARRGFSRVLLRIVAHRGEIGMAELRVVIRVDLAVECDEVARRRDRERIEFDERQDRKSTRLNSSH